MNYYRIMLGKGSSYADQALQGNFIGADFGINRDLSGNLPEDWRAFNREFIPVYLTAHPGKTKVAAGLACGALWTVAKGIQNGDVVLCPNGQGEYFVGEVVGGYAFHPSDTLPHRRTVKWANQTIKRSDMSRELRNSAGSAGTTSNITKHRDEIDALLAGRDTYLSTPVLAVDDAIEDPSVFVLEKHLEDFLVRNWAQTELGQKYDIYTEDGEQIGQQYPTDTGPLDILAVSRDKKELLVVELKRGRVSDIVVGQIQRYMGYVKEELAEPEQAVRGLIIALEDDSRIRRALVVAPDISFFRYQISFKLHHVAGVKP